MRSGMIHPPGASSLILLRMLNVGAAYPDIVRQTPEKYPRSVGHRKDMGGRVGRTEAMEPEEVFFLTLVFSLVSKTNFSSLRKGKGGIPGRE